MKGRQYQYKCKLCSWKCKIKDTMYRHFYNQHKDFLNEYIE